MTHQNGIVGSHSDPSQARDLRVGSSSVVVSYGTTSVPRSSALRLSSVLPLASSVHLLGVLSSSTYSGRIRQAYTPLVRRRI